MDSLQNLFFTQPPVSCSAPQGFDWVRCNWICQCAQSHPFLLTCRKRLCFVSWLGRLEERQNRIHALDNNKK